MSQNTSPKPIQRILVILSGLAFAGSSIVGMAQLFTNTSQKTQNTPTTEAGAKNLKLKEQERGYELVIQREPNNQLALQGLVQTRLQMNDLKGAVEPMEKLVKLNPDNPQYKALLAGIKQRVGPSK